MKIILSLQVTHSKLFLKLHLNLFYLKSVHNSKRQTSMCNKFPAKLENLLIYSRVGIHAWIIKWKPTQKKRTFIWT